MRVLLTGIAGFIGSHLADRLVARGDELVGLDNFDPFYDRRMKERNLAALRGKVDFRREHPRRDWSAFLAGGRFEVVVHLAALAGCARAEAPARYIGHVEAPPCSPTAIRAGWPRVVFASSSSVPTATARRPVREDDGRRPGEPYGATSAPASWCLRECTACRAVSSLRFFSSGRASDGDAVPS